jgi:hypothetical protein
MISAGDATSVAQLDEQLHELQQLFRNPRNIRRLEEPAFFCGMTVIPIGKTARTRKVLDEALTAREH